MQDLRRKQIADIILNVGSVKISDLANQFDISEMTVHRDLDYLQDQGVLQKRRGGAIANNFSEMFSNRSIKNIEQKKVIAKKAYNLIEEHDVLVMDGSTTSIEIAKLIKNGKDLTVFTNSLHVLYELESSDNIELYVLGNTYSHKMVHFIGNEIEKELLKLKFSKCFFGSAGVSPDLSLYEPYPILASIKRVMIQQSIHAYAVVDSSKFGTYSVQKICDAGEITDIITDNDISVEYREKLASMFENNNG